MTDLPRPGAVGVLIRLLMAALVGWMGVGAISGAAGFWDGFDAPVSAVPYVLVLGLFSSWVVNELFQREWGSRPSGVLLLGLAVAVGLGALQGDAWGSWFGVYLWAWVVGFAVLLGPAHLLAAVLRTPGCEMRSYAHLWTLLRGGDPSAVPCPGWIDRFDGVRLGRRGAR